MEPIILAVTSTIFGQYSGPFWAVAGGAVTAYFTKMFGKNKDKRDDFTAITDALYKQVQHLSERVDQTEHELKHSKDETRKCEERYTELVERYTELTTSYRSVIETNEELSQEVEALRQKLQAHISSTQSINDTTGTDSRASSFII
jgi:predicted  nucleic acid-binding Zn-ribbon protein